MKTKINDRVPIYKLDADNRPVRCKTYEELEAWLKSRGFPSAYSIQRTELDNDIVISTVFMPYPIDGGMFFETLGFVDDADGKELRHSYARTYEDALRHHRNMVSAFSVA